MVGVALKPGCRKNHEKIDRHENPDGGKAGAEKTSNQIANKSYGDHDRPSTGSPPRRPHTPAGAAAGRPPGGRGQGGGPRGGGRLHTFRTQIPHQISLWREGECRWR